MAALHYRWNNPKNSAWATAEFGRCAFPWLPSTVSSRLARPFAAKMQSLRAVQGASSLETQAGIERHTEHIIAVLESHLAASELPYLLGGRPSRGDFSLCEWLAGFGCQPHPPSPA